MNSAGFSERYSEILYAHIQDMQGSRLSYTHCTSRVRYDSLLDISFDRPVYIYRNQIYKVFVVFNKIGWYPMYNSVLDVECNRVKFSIPVNRYAVVLYEQLYSQLPKSIHDTLLTKIAK